MLNEIELGLETLESAAPSVRSFLDELPEIFTAAGKTLHEGPETEAVAARLFHMPRQAPMRTMLRAALSTNDTPTLSSVRNFFHMPTEVRTLLDEGGISRLTGLFREGTPASLGEARSTFTTLGELAPYAQPDRSGAQVLESVARSGISGHNSWLDAPLKLSLRHSF